MNEKEKLNLMIVEDESVIVLHLEDTLKNLGYNVIGSFASGEECLDKINNKIIPDLIFMDIQLSGKLDGIETTEQINKVAAVPVIYLTSNTNKSIIERAKKTNPAAFLSKPFDESQVFSAIEISSHRFKTIRQEEEKQKKQLQMNEMQISELMETQQHLVTATWRERELKEELQKTKSIIEEQNKKILDSINYAKRIQKAIIPDDKALKESLGEYSMIYKAKDLVSGDFPWMAKNGKYTYIAAVDCTGHGVPGAMMSLIGYLLLNDLANDIEPKTPAQVLNGLHERLVNTLKQNLPDSNSNDGMDIALCRICREENEVIFAGAHRPLFFIKNGELQEIKGDKFPIGGIQYEKKRVPFQDQKLEISKDDAIFMFSDGFPDQTGGTEKKKFMTGRIFEIINTNRSKALSEIRNHLDSELVNWMEGHKQIDDILMIGIKF